jgi:hypothetical protein
MKKDGGREERALGIFPVYWHTITSLLGLLRHCNEAHTTTSIHETVLLRGKGRYVLINLHFMFPVTWMEGEHLFQFWEGNPVRSHFQTFSIFIDFLHFTRKNDSSDWWKWSNIMAFWILLFWSWNYLHSDGISSLVLVLLTTVANLHRTHLANHTESSRGGGCPSSTALPLHRRMTHSVQWGRRNTILRCCFIRTCTVGYEADISL